MLEKLNPSTIRRAALFEIFPAKDADKIVYHVRIRHLASRTEAQALAGQLRGKFGITDPSVR